MENAFFNHRVSNFELIDIHAVDERNSDIRVGTWRIPYLQIKMRTDARTRARVHGVGSHGKIVCSKSEKHEESKGRQARGYIEAQGGRD